MNPLNPLFSPAKAGAENHKGRDPGATLAALAHPGLNSVAAPRLVDANIIMSLWVHWKECTGRRSLYLVDVPFELAFLLIGIVIALVVVLLRRLF
jgi:hypothetical protein